MAKCSVVAVNDGGRAAERPPVSRPARLAQCPGLQPGARANIHGTEVVTRPLYCIVVVRMFMDGRAASALAR